MTLKKIRKVQTVEDLENLGIGQVAYEISHRGGGIGFRAKDVANALDIEEYYLPRKFGAGCNYLGGGVRSSIFPSDYADEITGKKKRELLNAIAEACVRVYENIENDSGLNDEGDDNEPNWEARATYGARQQGIRSAC